VAPALTGFERYEVQACHGPYAPRRDEADLVGERFEVGTTFYDYQANTTTGKMIVVDEDGNVHLVWMKGFAADPVSERHTFYNYVVDDEPQFEDGVQVDEADRAGYNNIGYAPDVGAIPIFHTQVGGGENYWGCIAQDADLGEGAFTVHQNPRDDDRNFVWPHGTIDRNGRSHLLSRNHPDQAFPLDMQYVRGWINEDDEWEFTDPVIVWQVKGLGYTVAASQASDKVALVFMVPAYDQDEEGNRWQGFSLGGAMNNNILVIESDDGEEFDWGNPINITDIIRSDIDENQNSPFYLGDTLRPYHHVDACYDADDNLHVVFSAALLVENPDRNSAQGWTAYDDRKNLVWHWDRESGELSLIADAWYAADGNQGAWRMNISFPSVGVAEDGALYAVGTVYPPQGATAANGLINGEIYATVSLDGGRTWAEATNLTDTPAQNSQPGEGASESWSTLAEVVDDNLHISYVLDLDPGGTPQGEGQATENPFMYHRVSRDDIPTEPLIMGRDFHVGWPPEIAVAEEEVRSVSVPEGDPGLAELTIANTNEEGTGLHVQVSASVEIAEAVSFDPTVIRIAPGQEETITVIFTPLEEGIFEGDILIEHNDPDVHSPLEVAFNGMAVAGYGLIAGRAFNLANDEAVSGAVVELTPGGYTTISNEEGLYQFEQAPALRYQLTCRADDFLLFEGEVEVGVDGEVEFNIGLRFATFDLLIDGMDVPVPFDDTHDEGFNAENRGNGPVTFQAELLFPEEEQIDPFVLRDDFPAAEIVGDNRLNAVAFVDDKFFVAGGNSGNLPNLIYILDRDGEYIDSLEQFSDSRNGMRDLAWDGVLMWGADEGTIYSFTLDGELAGSFEGPLNDNRGLTYDSDRELLWVCDLTGDLIAIDREGGGQLRGFAMPEEELVYGLAYCPDDEDGYPLYLFSNSDEGDTRLLKCNPDEEDYLFVADLPVPNEGRAGGCEMTQVWAPYSWVMVGLLQGNPDAVAVWQITPRRDWISLEPMAGEIAAEGSGDFTVHLNTLGFPAMVELCSIIRFTHNGRGGPAELPIQVDVTEEGGLTQRTLTFQLGWNLVSLNITPEPEEMREIIQPLVDDGSLILVKDGEGNFIMPDREYYDIPLWNQAEGYQFKLSRSDRLEVPGIRLASDHPILLEEGWQLIAYYPRDAIDARVALAGIEEELIIVKDGFGFFYIPAYGFSNIGEMDEGEGYQVKMDSTAELVYQMGDELQGSEPLSPLRFTLPAPTMVNMSVLLLDVAPGLIEIAACDPNGRVVGAGVVNDDGMCGLAVWGRGDYGESGLSGGEPFSLVGWDGSAEVDLEVQWMSGSVQFQPDAIAVGRLALGRFIPDKFVLYPSYPNPFNALARIRYDLPEASRVRLELFDTAGRLVAVLASGDRPAGRHSVIIDADGMASGVYFYRIQAGSFLQMRKAILLR